jgi:hypothetical protein
MPSAPRSEAERRASRRESVLRDVARAWARRRRLAARHLELRPARRLP